MDNNNKSLEEVLPLVLGAAGAAGVLPFAVMRLLNGDFLLAAFDAVLFSGFVYLTYYLHRSHRVRVASIALATMGVIGAVVSVYLRGAGQIFWLYAVLVGCFYLLNRREATLAAALSTALIIPPIAQNVSPFTLTTILCTLAVTCLLSFAFATVTRRQRDSLMQLARKDPLTGAGNRLALEERMREIITAGTRSTDAASLLMLDLDHFKKINDTYGHAAGDQILVRICEIINLRIRVTDSIYRIGGEEFVVVVSGQNLTHASRLAEQLRTIVEANELGPGEAVTISIGVAEYQRGEAATSWLRRADDALYMAKHAGRNNTKLAA